MFLVSVEILSLRAQTYTKGCTLVSSASKHGTGSWIKQISHITNKFIKLKILKKWKVNLPKLQY